MWLQADQKEMTLEPMENFGWSISDGDISIVWDSEVNKQTVRNRVNSLMKGCKCSTGCSSGRCGCKRRGVTCSVGCQCVNCTNTQASSQSQDEDVQVVALEEDLSSGRLTDPEDMIDWVFGPDTLNTECSDSEVDEPVNT